MLARERLKAFRESLGLSQREFAKLLRCDQTYVSKVEEGKRTNPSAAFTHRLQLLSKDWTGGPIRTEEWLAADVLKVKLPRAAGEASR